MYFSNKNNYFHIIKDFIIIILFILYIYKKKIYLLIKRQHFLINAFIDKVKEKLFHKKNSFQNYLEANKIKWSKINNSNSNSSNKILVSNFVGHSAFTMTECLIGKYLSIFSTSDIVGLLSKRDQTGKKIFKSFNIKKFYIYEETNLLKKIKLLTKSINILKSINSIEQFINLEIDKIHFGKIVYDHYIRYTGIPSENKIKLKFYFFLADALFINELCKNIFKIEKISILVASEIQFIPAAVIFQNALKHNAAVYARDGGPTTFSIRKFADSSEIYTNFCKYPKSLIDLVSKNKYNLAVEKGDEIIRKRFSNQPLDNDIRDAEIAFSKTSKTYTKKQLCDLFNWDYSKPIACIFAANLLDGNYLNGDKLFQDNLTWFRATLNEIKNTTNINWIIKEHPTYISAGQKAKISSVDEYYRICGNEKHICLLPKEISGSSLKNLISLAVTSLGSVGIEYPSLGIPCLRAADSHYGDFDFSINPKTQEEYFSYLCEINKIPKLSVEQINEAKIFTFVQFAFTKFKHPLLPNYSITRLGKKAQEKFWHESKHLIQNYNIKNDKFMKMFKYQYINNNRHLINLDIL
jgi:hypothetical protein|tara:strand:- start:820 stop:2556 length:1737 start_codon:yes stop_codon:yes gene_type:complete